MSVVAQSSAEKTCNVGGVMSCSLQFFFDVFCNPNPPVIDLRTFTNLADGDTGLDDISVRCTCSGTIFDSVIFCAAMRWQMSSFV